MTNKSYLSRLLGYFPGAVSPERTERRTGRSYSSHFTLHSSFFILSFFILLAACASIGSPDGGPYDETPPRVLSASPQNQAVRNDKKNINIYFNEYIKLENASEKVVVSPPQKEMPNIRAVGKHVRINLFDTLLANTTYTVDFSDAIVDNNEGNPMGHFTYSFSTGDAIDTMEVSGYVLNAADMEPVKGILVGLYAEPTDTLLPDSVLRSRPFDRVGRTNGSGRFIIKGVAACKRYRAFALKDADGNFTFSQKSEAIAWDTLRFSPSCRPDIRLDTIWADSTHYDSIQPVRYTHFFPDDIVLRAFIEEGQDRHLLKQERLVPEKFTFFFTAPADTLPIIRGINFEGDGGFVLEPSIAGDTVTYWIPDTNIAYADTLSMYYSYLETDTTGVLAWRTDTLDLIPKQTRAQQLKEIEKKTEEWEKEQKKKQRRNKNLQPEENPHLKTFLTVECKPSGTIDPFHRPLLTSSEPLATTDSAGIHFQMKVDTLWVDTAFTLTPSDINPRQLQLSAEWELGQQYQLVIDSAAFSSIFGNVNKPIKQEFRVHKEEDYGALFIQVQLPDTVPVIVQLMSASDKPVRTETAGADGRADFFYLKPGEYYLRCFEDTNEDGVWTTGEYDSQRQPEHVYYFPKPLIVKAQWEVEQKWDCRGIPAYRQKPAKITKQKPDKEKKVRDRNREREEKKRSSGSRSSRSRR